MKIGNLEVGLYEKKTGWLQVTGNKYQLPLVVIRGGEGKTTLITGGIHNAEYVGIQTAIELGRELQPEDINGTLIIVPLVNVSGFTHRTMSLTYEDYKNLNREFPGNANGTISEQICHTITSELFSRADYYIDLHCGDGYEELSPYVYYVGPVNQCVRETALRMAKCVEVPYIIESQCTTAGAYNYANSIGIPSIMIERGCRGMWSREEVEQDKKEIRKILGMLYAENKADDKKTEPEQIILRNAVYENAPCDGCWYAMYKPGEHFKKGAVLGEIRDYFGNVLFQYIAKSDGVILFQVSSLSILKDGPMIAFGVFP